MASDLWNIFLNVVAAFIYAGIIWLWERRGGQPPAIASKPKDMPVESEQLLNRRERNRQTIERATHRFLFYFVTFGALYLSVTMPPLFKALFAKGDVLLSSARFIGGYLPPVPVGKEYLQITFFAIAAVFYFPLLALAEAITSLLYPIIDSFHQVTYRIWSAVTMITFFLFCIPVAATSIWLFYEKSFQDSLLTVLFALLLAFVFGQVQSERK
jgi:hypothetical protein